MKRSIAIRQLMKDKNMKVSDISKESGIAYSTIKSILEKGTEKASYINICKICSALGITPDELEYMVKSQTVKLSGLSKEDKLFIDKYRNLDKHGKDMVDTVLDKEYSRSVSAQSDKIVTLHQTELAAAHQRTDVAQTSEGQKHDLDIMNDDKLWEE